MALVTIKMVGVLAKKFITKFEADVRTPREAINAIDANFPGFYSEIQRLSNRGFVWKFFVGDTPVAADDLNSFPVGAQELAIVPVISFSGVIGKVILGAALIGVGLLTGGTTLILLGATLALSGFSSLFNPPKDKAKQQKQNYLYNGGENSVAIGQKIPIVFGTLRTGSMVISANIVSYQI